MKAHLVGILLLVSGFPAVVSGQTMQTVTSPPGPGLQIVLSWPGQTPTDRYNLYRKTAGDPNYPASPLNSAPIQRQTSCAAIQTVIPPGSLDWLAIANGIDPATP